MQQRPRPNLLSNNTTNANTKNILPNKKDPDQYAINSVYFYLILLAHNCSHTFFHNFLILKTSNWSWSCSLVLAKLQYQDYDLISKTSEAKSLAHHMNQYVFFIILVILNEFLNQINNFANHAVFYPICQEI